MGIFFFIWFGFSLGFFLRRDKEVFYFLVFGRWTGVHTHTLLRAHTSTSLDLLKNANDEMGERLGVFYSTWNPAPGNPEKNNNK